VAAQASLRQLDGLHAQRRQPWLDRRAAGQQTHHRSFMTIAIGEAVQGVEQSTAFGEQRAAFLDVRVQIATQVIACGERVDMQFGITTGQPGRIAIGQRITGHGREERQIRARVAQHVEVGGIEKGECRIACDGDA
jgi:hypothetical protein